MKGLICVVLKEGWSLSQAYILHSDLKWGVWYAVLKEGWSLSQVHILHSALKWRVWCTVLKEGWSLSQVCILVRASSNTELYCVGLRCVVLEEGWSDHKKGVTPGLSSLILPNFPQELPSLQTCQISHGTPPTHSKHTPPPPPVKTHKTHTKCTI